MKTILTVGVALFAAVAGAATPAEVERGDLEIVVKASGTVVADGVFLIKSAIEGRVESVPASTYAWHKADQTLAWLAHRELAAMIDSKGSQDVGILEDRWQRVFRPAPARCRDTCFILKSFLKLKTWIKPESPMFEAASTLKLVGRVRPEDAYWIRDGQELVFWPLADPRRVLRGRVAQYRLDRRDAKDSAPGGAFTLIMPPDRSLVPGTAWEGRIIPLSRKGALHVPTGALIRRGEDTYLTVRVSTGITTRGRTEVTSGVQEGRGILILGDSQLSGAQRYAPEDDHEALRLRARERRDAEAWDEGRPAPAKRRDKHAEVIDNADYGEDPYAEPQ
ncbi:MAG: efflux RND transporter periplasmic adaptor subunit [Elusimicrobia bacterium]|nr:efflux RND transporter periplasmic adaptor subunit [Elusimicrobiota bacterium]